MAADVGPESAPSLVGEDEQGAAGGKRRLRLAGLGAVGERTMLRSAPFGFGRRAHKEHRRARRQ